LNVVMPPHKLSIHKALVAQQFRRWNPNFFEYFSYANGRWEPNRQGELARRLQSRNEHALEKKQAEKNTPSSSTTPLPSSTPMASPRIRLSNGTRLPPAPNTATGSNNPLQMPSSDAQAEKYISSQAHRWCRIHYTIHPIETQGRYGPTLPFTHIHAYFCTNTQSIDTIHTHTCMSAPL
jgi:hypothetical protein